MAESANSTGARILVVDDEKDICEILEFNLENAGYVVDTASSAEDALEKLTPEHRLILLDVMMAGMSGFRMAEVVRKERHLEIPIIFLTARSTENDMLTGFSAGGDDYISKPFSIQEVLARVKAVLRRSSPSSGEQHTDVLETGSLQIDPKSKMVYVYDTPVTLSKKEFELISLLAAHPGKVFSREEIIDRLWKDAPYVLDRTIDVHIARIRATLGPMKSCITNRSGFGYSFHPLP